MDQVALPYRIALVALLLVGAIWFVVLKPGPVEEEPATTAPGVTGLANDVDKAKDAAAQESAANQAAANADPGATTTGSTGASSATGTSSSSSSSATPKAKADLLQGVGLDDPSRDLLRFVQADGHVGVLLFWNRRGSDDRAVRQAVEGIDRHRGKVVTEIASINEVGNYAAITRGVQVDGSPTVLVIDTTGKARVISGLTTTGEIDQLVSDVGGTALRSRAKR